ncbi:phosphonate transport system ATP-binding protein [Chromohalobacter marismortui]|uniref:Phosphonate transport system ATP-binding protein n=1 Tax=Chromohalobacter marismortui TaxID=42055 RepID=A0A4R7NLK2_9GAMM|nr:MULTISPECIES: ATP-binding cassette domain-containing protein [Chromohalobacter]MCI0510227.1 ATP-binding cassette domain-containing protein [Chromohalobacter sp.]MCI0593403.1 ATP-binding cassette domain-containing protein [Chromohalobacter sp.]TDU21645.1 phosphonate transport system ATP-binding protein [Chromohalobacter marismortui]
MKELVHFDGEALGHARHTVLADLTLGLQDGQRVALLGPSGVGKSTLLATLRERLGQRAAWCPQEHGLVPPLSVYHNIYMGRLEHHSALANLVNLLRPRRDAWRDIQALCAELGLSGLLKRPVVQLSGGQRQRVAIARALYQVRDVFLGDELVASIDPYQARRLLTMIQRQHATCVIALHQRELALTHFDHVWGLRDGQLILDAPAHELTLADLDTLYPDAGSTDTRPEPA